MCGHHEGNREGGKVGRWECGHCTLNMSNVTTWGILDASPGLDFRKESIWVRFRGCTLVQSAMQETRPITKTGQ